MIDNFACEKCEMQAELDILTTLKVDHYEVALLEEWMVEVQRLKAEIMKLEEKWMTSHAKHLTTFKKLTILSALLARLRREGCILLDLSKTRESSKK